eukprot:4026207-Amphidinium_carterae.1
MAILIHRRQQTANNNKRVKSSQEQRKMCKTLRATCRNYQTVLMHSSQAKFNYQKYCQRVH